MADLTITASQVLKGANATTENLIAGEAITAGQVVYKSTSTNKALKADASAAATAVAYGIALNDANADGAPVTVQTGGTITLGAGAAPAAGAVYVVSATAGGIAPEGDILSTEFVTVLGIGDGSSGMKMGILVQGTAHA